MGAGLGVRYGRWTKSGWMDLEGKRAREGWLWAGVTGNDGVIGVDESDGLGGRIGRK